MPFFFLVLSPRICCTKCCSILKYFSSFFRKKICCKNVVLDRAGSQRRNENTKMLKNESAENCFCMYILIKRDICAKLFLLSQIHGFMCNFKSIIKLSVNTTRRVPYNRLTICSELRICCSFVD